MTEVCFVGVDVGTGSARAGVFDCKGRHLGSAAYPLATTRPRAGYAQQSSAAIWASVTQAVRQAIATADVEAARVTGIGFDATCSCVVSGADGAAVSIDPDGAPDQDVILWMDHRARAEADEINTIGGAPLDYVGGHISPEMELPKLLWLKRHLPQAWNRAHAFWDLPDWLVHRATGSLSRSLCSTVCKWTYLGHKGTAGEGWDDGFLAAIGLGDLSAEGHAAIGAHLVAPATPVGGLTAGAAHELGLPEGTPVAASMIDAHAGALGTLGIGTGGTETLERRLAVIAGTSTCHIALSSQAMFVGGVWGPYFGAVLPGLWALEGGQSAAGALIDHVITRHAEGAALAQEAARTGQRPTDLLNRQLEAMGAETATLSHSRHVLPDFHGNRSPLAEPWRQGAVSGLTLETGRDDLALDYLATVQALAYGTRHILEAMSAAGARIECIVMSGGLANNTLYVREHADATGCTVLVPCAAEPVLLGSAMLGAVASKTFADLPAAMADMSGDARTVLPRGGDIARYHSRKYNVLRRMQDDHRAWRSIMEET